MLSLRDCGLCGSKQPLDGHSVPAMPHNCAHGQFNRLWFVWGLSNFFMPIAFQHLRTIALKVERLSMEHHEVQKEKDGSLPFWSSCQFWAVS